MQAYLTVEILINNKPKPIHRIKVEATTHETVHDISNRATKEFCKWEKDQSWLVPGTCYINLTIKLYQ